MRVMVDSGGYTSACTYLYDANHAVVDGVIKLASVIDGGGAMAGTDSGGEAFAKQYDAVAGPLLQAGADLGESLGQMANLLNAALLNHAGADYGASIGAGPEGGGPDGDSDPDHWTETVLCPDPPSAAGGIGGAPGWWHWIASHLEGLLWPDADTGKLRAVGNAWVTAGNTLIAETYAVDDASTEVSVSQSPEIGTATSTLSDLRTHLQDVGSAYVQLGHACTQYADDVDKHHSEIISELESFIEWTAGIEVAGGILGALTFGIGEGAAQAAEGAEVANAASKVVRILKDLVELAKTAATTIGDLLKTATAALERVKVILNAKVVKALDKVAPFITKESRSRLLADLAEQGIKHSPDDVVTIFRNADGKIVWLEKGNERAGLQHIVDEHGAQFAQRGIAEKDIPSVLQKALTDGKIVGHQGKGLGRPIYEVTVNGKTTRIAITTSKNGFIVGANPA